MTSRKADVISLKDISLNQFSREYIQNSYDISTLCFYLSSTCTAPNLFREEKAFSQGCVQTKVPKSATLTVVTKGG